MTKEEAIDIISRNCYVFKPTDFDRTTMINTAIDMAIDALKQEREPILDKKSKKSDILKLLNKTFSDFINSEGGDSYLRIDGKEYYTDVGYAVEGLYIFMEVFERRLAESEVEG